MKPRTLKITFAAQQDIREAWRLVRRRDGKERADSLKNRIMGFALQLGEFAEIGTRHDDTRPGLRSTGVPGLKTASVFFFVSGDKVTVVGVSYLGRDVWSRFEERESYDPWFKRQVSEAVAAADAGGPFVSHKEVIARSKARIKSYKKR